MSSTTDNPSMTEIWHPTKLVCTCGKPMTRIETIKYDDDGEPYIPLLVYGNQTRNHGKENAIFRSRGSEHICTNPKCLLFVKKKRTMVRHNDAMVKQLWGRLHHWKQKMVAAGRWHR